VSKKADLLNIKVGDTDRSNTV